MTLMRAVARAAMKSTQSFSSVLWRVRPVGSDNRTCFHMSYDYNAPDDAVAGYAPVGHGPDRARGTSYAGTVARTSGRPRPMLATWRSDMVPREIIENN